MGVNGRSSTVNVALSSPRTRITARCVTSAVSSSPPTASAWPSGLDRHAGLGAWPDVVVPQARGPRVGRAAEAGLGLEALR